MENYNWLPHLDGYIPKFAYGDKIDMYLIALEGWRRGLKLKIRSVGNKRLVRFSLSNENKTHSFSVTRGDKVDNQAVRICMDKLETKRYLNKAGVNVPKGKKFITSDQENDLVQFAEDIGFPVVLKPVDGRRGQGVFSNITSKKELNSLLPLIQKDYNQFIIEKHFIGEEFRVYIVGEEVAGVIKRFPANIIGDGKRTIKELIDEKNRKRKLVPNLHKRLIEIDDEINYHLTEAGYKLDSILEDKVALNLREKANLSTGGDSLDYTDEVPAEVKNIAIKAAKAIPNLPQCGVDVLYSAKDNEATVIEVNSRAGVGGHMFPLQGRARDVPKAIIDFYFPETKGIRYNNFYFDLETYWFLLKEGKAKEVAVPNVPKTSVCVKCTIDSRVIDEKMLKNIYSRATKFGINGSINIKRDLVVIIAAGRRDKVELFLDYINSSNSNFDIKKTRIPIKLGFEYQSHDYLKSNFNNLKQEVKGKNEEITLLTQKLKNVQKSNQLIKESKSWRYTSFIRKAVKIFK